MSSLPSIRRHDFHLRHPRRQLGLRGTHGMGRGTEVRNQQDCDLIGTRIQPAPIDFKLNAEVQNACIS